MKPYFSDEWVTLYHGDCRDVLPGLGQVETCITDPPYGLEFMGKEWDKLGATIETVNEGADKSHPFRDGTRRVRYGKSAESMQEWYREHFAAVRNALLPGAMCLAFGGTRTHHRLMCAIEDAGFEIRDCLMWLYGSGFPKSLDVSKALDKMAGAEREVVGRKRGVRGADGSGHENVMPGKATGIKQAGIDLDITAPATDAAKLWDGWGTAL